MRPGREGALADRSGTDADSARICADVPGISGGMRAELSERSGNSSDLTAMLPGPSGIREDAEGTRAELTGTGAALAGIQAELAGARAELAAIQAELAR